MPTRELWVCWRRPRKAPPSGSVLLSYLPPRDEEALGKVGDLDLRYARAEVSAVRDAARAVYLELVADLGLLEVGTGRTLRSVLGGQNKASSWWFHPVTLKSPEFDPTFQRILTVMTIDALGRRTGATGLRLFGAEAEVAVVLASRYPVANQDGCRGRSLFMTAIRGVASRIKLLLRGWRVARLLRRVALPTERRFDVLFSSFWDWSFWWDEKEGVLVDRYFRQLPQALCECGIRDYGWLASCDPDYEASKRGRPLRRVLAPLAGRQDVVMLQAFLRLGDYLKAVASLRPIFAFAKAMRRPSVQRCFVRGGLDFYPLFRARLWYGFLNGALPSHELTRLATERAVIRHRPKVTLSFLEHFPYSRAHYDGVRRASPETICVAVQHASCNRDKTFCHLHPRKEFLGMPDGCRVPRPDYVCVMGTLGKSVFGGCGYEPGTILLTGSPRYDHVIPEPLRLSRRSGRLDVLVALALGVSVEIELVEAAVLAAAGIPKLRLRVRDHPLSNVQAHPRFEQVRGRLDISSQSLKEDLAQASLVLFTYSTVADEAFLTGIPVWQWRPAGFDGSALAESVEIPRFHSVGGLRKALLALVENPDAFNPTEEQRQRAWQALFAPADGQAAKRIARFCNQVVHSRACPQAVPLQTCR